MRNPCLYCGQPINRWKDGWTIGPLPIDTTFKESELKSSLVPGLGYDVHIPGLCNRDKLIQAQAVYAAGGAV